VPQRTQVIWGRSGGPNEITSNCRIEMTIKHWRAECEGGSETADYSPRVARH